MTKKKTVKKMPKKEIGMQLSVGAIEAFCEKEKESVLPRLKKNIEESREILGVIYKSLEIEDSRGSALQEGLIEHLNHLGRRLDSQTFGKAMNDLKAGDEEIIEAKQDRNSKLLSYHKNAKSLVWNAISAVAADEGVPWVTACKSLIASLNDSGDVAEEALELLEAESEAA